MLTHPAGITDVTCSGSKYYTGSWPGIVGVQKMQTNTVWVTVRNETAPSTTSAWEDYGPVSLALGDDYPAVRFVIDGTLSSVINEMAAVQYDTVSVTFSTAALQVISLGSETAINHFDFKLTNTTTGEWIKVRTPCPVNTALVVDCETQTAYLADGRVVPVTLSSDKEVVLASTARPRSRRPVSATPPGGAWPRFPSRR